MSQNETNGQQTNQLGLVPKFLLGAAITAVTAMGAYLSGGIHLAGMVLVIAGFYGALVLLRLR